MVNSSEWLQLETISSLESLNSVHARAELRRISGDYIRIERIIAKRFDVTLPIV